MGSLAYRLRSSILQKHCRSAHSNARRWMMGVPIAQEPIQYLISESGERTGVVLSWEAYTALRGAPARDQDLVDELIDLELHALAEGMLAAGQQERLNALLDRNASDQLDRRERQELDTLLAGVDALNLLKARARLTLNHRTAAAA